MCWLWHDSKRCVFRMAGSEVATVDWSASAVLRLDDGAALTGAFVANGRGKPVKIRIPLLD